MDELTWFLDGSAAHYVFINEVAEQRIRELAYFKWLNDAHAGVPQKTSEEYWEDAKKDLHLDRELRISDFQSTDTFSS